MTPGGSPWTPARPRASVPPVQPCAPVLNPRVVIRRREAERGLFSWYYHHSAFLLCPLRYSVCLLESYQSAQIQCCAVHFTSSQYKGKFYKHLRVSCVRSANRIRFKVYSFPICLSMSHYLLLVLFYTAFFVDLIQGWEYWRHCILLQSCASKVQ